MGQGNTKLTITDILPEGVTLDSLQLTGWNNMSVVLTVAENGSITGTDNTNRYNITGSYGPQFVPEGEGTVTRDVITLEITPKTENDAIQTGAEFTLTINCKVANASSQSGTLTLTNKAEMRLDNQTAADTPISSSEQTQKWTYDRQVVDKSGSWDNDNRIMNYTVILNPDGKDLVEGVDTMTLVDTMTYSNQVTLYWPHSGTYDIDATLIQSSVKLHEAHYDEATGWTPGQEVTGWSWVYDTKVENQTSETNTITATGIPDEKCLMFRYSYRVTSNIPEEVILSNGTKYNPTFNIWLNNKAALQGTGHSDDYSSNQWEWKHSSSSAGVTTDKSYTFYKVEAGNYNVSLAGATFSVYKYDNGSYGETAVKTYTTDSSGSFQITRQEKDSGGTAPFTYDYNTLYKVVETAAPEGYWMPDVVNTYYFYFSSTEDTDHTLPQDRPADAVDLSSEAKTVYVENVKNTTEISVKKVWGNGTDGHPDSITFDLYQLASGETLTDDKQPFLPNLRVKSQGNESSNNGDYTITYGDWETTISNLPKTGTDSSNQTVNYVYVVKETTTGYTVAYSNNDGITSGEITITNTTQSYNTSIRVEKKWENARCEPIENPDYSIQLQLHQALNGAKVENPTWGSDIQSVVTLPNNDAWSYTWQNLPDGYQYYVTEEWVHAGSDQTDIKGNFVVYYDGNKGGDASSAVNGSTIVITNLLKGPGRRPTKVTAEKDWKQGEEQASPGADSVTLQLYQVKNTPAAFDSLATIENPSNGTLTILNGRDFDDPTLFLRFTVKTNEDKRDGWGAGALSNARYEPYTDLFINASTQDSTVYRYFALQDLKDVKDGLTLNFWAKYAELLTVEVVRATSSTTAEAVAVEPAVELNSENKWRAEWTGLPTVVESTGEYYTYYVVETAVDGYTTTYQVGGKTYTTASDAAVDPYGSITVTNTKQPETTSITVKKEWKDSNGNDLTTLPTTGITFDLYRIESATPPQQTVIVDGQNGTKVNTEPLTITANSWTATVTDLPTMGTSNGKAVYYTYYVVETPVEGYDTTYSVGEDGSTITVTNKKQPETTSITVNKVWLDSSNGPIDGNTESLPASITFYLTRTANGKTEQVDSDASTDGVQPYTLTKENSWTMTIENLPLKDSSGNTYSYSATEVSVEGYTPAVTVNGTSITITNTQTPTPSGTSLTVKKEWKNADGSDLAVDNYSVTVQLAQVQTTVTGGSPGEVIQEKTVSNKNDWNQWDFSADQLGKSNLSVRITYLTQADFGGWNCGTVSVYDSSNKSWNVVSQLYIASSNAGQYSDTISLGNLSSNHTMVSVNFWGWYTPKGQTEKITYATLEKVELIETTVTGGTTTVTEDTNYSTQILNSGNNWSYTWANLPASEGNTTYTYYVKEVRVENAEHTDIADKFTVTNEHGDKDHAVGVDGSITITNTLKSTYVLPETGGAGIGFYRIGGSLLMGVAAAGLIGNTKRKKRKEADKTS